MGQNIFKSPKAKVQAVAPKALQLDTIPERPSMAWPAAVLPCFISRFLYRPQKELGRWMHGRNRFTQIDIGHFLPPFHGFSMDGKDKRHEAAKRLMYDNLGQQTHLGFNESHCHVGMQEYERYLAERKEAAIVAKTILNSAKVGSPKE